MELREVSQTGRTLSHSRARCKPESVWLQCQCSPRTSQLPFDYHEDPERLGLDSDLVFSISFQLQVQPSMELPGAPTFFSPAGPLCWHCPLSPAYSTWRMPFYTKSKDPWKAFKNSLEVLMAGSNLVQFVRSSVGYNQQCLRGDARLL